MNSQPTRPDFILMNVKAPLDNKTPIQLQRTFLETGR